MRYQLDLGVADHEYLTEFVKRHLALKPKERSLVLDRRVTISTQVPSPIHDDAPSPKMKELKFVLPQGQTLKFFPESGGHQDNRGKNSDGSRFIVVLKQEQLTFTRAGNSLAVKVTDVLRRPNQVGARQLSAIGVGL
jgi:hypothetical protein